MQSTLDCTSSCNFWTDQGLMWGSCLWTFCVVTFFLVTCFVFVDSSAFNTIIPTHFQTKLTQLSVPSSICQWITRFLTNRQQLVRLGKFMSNRWKPYCNSTRQTAALPTLVSLGDVFSPHCSSPCTPTTSPLKTPVSSSWSLQMTPHWSASSRTLMSLPT